MRDRSCDAFEAWSGIRYVPRLETSELIHENMQSDRRLVSFWTIMLANEP